MGSPYLNRDESIILATHYVSISSIPYEAILTNQRLMLINSTNVQFQPQAIPLTSISSVFSGETDLGDPSITVSLNPTPENDAPAPIILAFSQRPRERKQERKEWVTGLKEQIASAREAARKSGAVLAVPDTISPPSLTQTAPVGDGAPSAPESAPAPGAAQPPSEQAGDTGQGTGGPAVVPAVEPAQTSPPPPPQQPAAPAAPGGRNKVIAVGVIIIAIAALICYLYLYAPALPGLSGGNKGAIAAPTGTPAPEIPTVVLTPVTATTPPAELTPQPTASGTAQFIVPENGVWVRVLYDGDFSGRVGLSSRLKEVTGSNDAFYQIPTVDGIVEATISKQDPSGKTLSIEIYKDGTMLKRYTTSVPYGVIDLHFNLKTI